MNITALDFETANYADMSICSAGVAVFVDGQLAESLHWLVRPPKGHGWFLEEFTENCHGMNWFDVKDAPEFPAVAPQLIQRLNSADIVVAHNAPFDMRKLRGTLEHFTIPCPAFNYLCTWRLSQRAWPDLPAHSLDAVAAHIGHDFQHHHAQADAEAAGRVMLAAMQQAGARTLVELTEKFAIETRCF